MVRRPSRRFKCPSRGPSPLPTAALAAVALAAVALAAAALAAAALAAAALAAAALAAAKAAGTEVVGELTVRASPPTPSRGTILWSTPSKGKHVKFSQLIGALRRCAAVLHEAAPVPALRPWPLTS